MDPQSGLSKMGGNYYTQRARSACAPTGISSLPAQKSAQVPAMSAPSAVDHIPRSDGTQLVVSPVQQDTDSFCSRSFLPALAWHDFSSTKTYRSPFPYTPPHFLEIYDRIITPYNASAFAIELSRFNLWHRYPFLIEYLATGFPLGNMPTLHESIIIPNHSSVHKHPEVVWDYILEEATADRMSGPFSQSEMETIMRGFFFCSPFIVAEQSEGPDKPPKYRVCRNLSKDGRDSLGNLIPCVNSYIHKEHFPTSFDSAVFTANLVSLSTPLSIP